MGRRLTGDLPTPPIDERETHAYLGLSYRDLEARLGRQAAADIYGWKARQGFEPVTILKRALEKYCPDLVVVTSSPRAEKAVVIAARELGIPSVALVDLFGCAMPWGADPHYADRLLVFSEMTREFLVARGRPEKDIVVTGNPCMDRLSDPAWQQKAMEWRKTRGWEKQRIIFWASQTKPPPHDDWSPAIDQAVRAAVAKHEDWRLIMRFHPGEAARFISDSRRIYVSPRQEDPTSLIFACNACLTINSTVGLEAAMIGKPVVSVDLSQTAMPLVLFSEMGIASRVRRLGEMEQRLTDALALERYYPPGLPPSAMPRRP